MYREGASVYAVMVREVERVTMRDTGDSVGRSTYMEVLQSTTWGPGQAFMREFDDVPGAWDDDHPFDVEGWAREG